MLEADEALLSAFIRAHLALEEHYSFVLPERPVVPARCAIPRDPGPRHSEKLSGWPWFRCITGQLAAGSLLSACM